MSKNRNARHRKSRVNRSPKRQDEALQIIEGVTLDGQRYAAVVSWCNDPNCTERHR